MNRRKNNKTLLSVKTKFIVKDVDLFVTSDFEAYLSVMWLLIKKCAIN